MKIILFTVFAGAAILISGCVDDQGDYRYHHHPHPAYSDTRVIEYPDRHYRDHDDRYYRERDDRYYNDRSDHTDVRVRF